MMFSSERLNRHHRTLPGAFALLLLLASGPDRVDAQTITLQLVDQGLAQVDGPAGAFGDFDNDGDMDILVSGRTAVEFPVPITRVYVGLGEMLRTPPGGGRPRWFREFEERGIGISAVWVGAAAWFDPNRDGRLEFVVTGSQNAEPPYMPAAAVYRSDGSGFARITNSLVGLVGGSIDVGDYNNDGKEDLLMTGSGVGGYMTLLYAGMGNGQFAQSAIQLPGIGLGDGRFGDFDGDGDLDIFLVGDSGAGLSAHLLRNENGESFIEVPATIRPVVFGSADWGDYDSDGDLDLLVAGARISPVLAEGRTHVYRNDGNGVFTDIQGAIDGTYHGFARWGDMDDDGSLDIVQAGGSGVTQLERAGQIYLYKGNDLFEFSFNIRGLTISAGDLGDYEGDGDLDVIQLGQGSVALYRNDRFQSETPPPLPNGRPSPPSELQSAVEGNAVTLSWTAGSDQETAENGLSYNIRIGTVPGSIDIVSPLAHPENGKRLVSRLGNVQNNRSWTIRSLASGTYYWSVQTLDASFSGSDFAEDQTFVIQ